MARPELSYEPDSGSEQLHKFLIFMQLFSSKTALRWKIDPIPPPWQIRIEILHKSTVLLCQEDFSKFHVCKKSSVATEDMSTDATEDMSSVAAEDMTLSSVATEVFLQKWNL